MAFSPDGSGMAYYLSGRVAACVSEVNDYSSRFYFYDDDRKGTLLCAVDEHAVGFAIGDDGARLVLNKTKGMLSDGDGTITHEWKWARGAQRAGKPPPRVELRLNDSISWELCMNASEATQRKQQLDRRAIDGGAAGSQRGYDVVLVSSACPPEECGALERLFKRAAGPAGSGKDVLVCGLAALSGDAGADALTVAAWVGKRRGVTMDVDVLLPPALAAIADVAITKPLKANALEDLVDFLESRAAAASRAEAGLPPADRVHKGLTKAALVKQLWESLKAGQRGAFLPDLKALRGGKKPKKIPLAPPIKRKVVFPPPPHDVTIESLIESKME